MTYDGFNTLIKMFSYPTPTQPTVGISQTPAFRPFELWRVPAKAGMMFYVSTPRRVLILSGLAVRTFSAEVYTPDQGCGGRWGSPVFYPGVRATRTSGVSYSIVFFKTWN